MIKGTAPGRALEPLLTLFGAGTTAGLTEGQLLERFAGRRGHDAEAAFAALVSRHGPMVRRVCRSLLADSNDADDAFQATVLVLARKAGAIRRRELLANWLYGTARCWWDGDRPDEPGQITTSWNIGGYPTFVLIDHRGVIRSKKDNHPFAPWFDSSIDLLVKEAESDQPRR